MDRHSHKHKRHPDEGGSNRQASTHTSSSVKAEVIQLHQRVILGHFIQAHFLGARKNWPQMLRSSHNLKKSTFAIIKRFPRTAKAN
jgi:hypothetical protein